MWHQFPTLSFLLCLCVCCFFFCLFNFISNLYLLCGGWQCTRCPQPLALTRFPLVKFFGFGWCCWSALHPPSSGCFSVRSGGLHSLAGARWSRPAGHLEGCADAEVPCWCFCSCCLTCWMISRILLCAVWKWSGGRSYQGTMTANLLQYLLHIWLDCWKSGIQNQCVWAVQ